MFHNRNVGRKILYSVGPYVLFTIVFAIIVIAIVVVRIRRGKRQQHLSQINRYADMLYDYALDIQDMTEDEAAITLGLFRYDKTLFPVSRTLANGDEVQDYAWNTNSEAFLDVILRIQGAMVLTTIKESSYYRNDKIWAMVKHFITTVQDKIPFRPTDHSFPWGENWYQFSISYPRFLVLAAYLHYKVYKRKDKTIQGYLSNYISQYYHKAPPNQKGFGSMGWVRDGPNAIMMCVPYIGGKILMKTLDEKNDSNVLYTTNYLDLKETLSGEGVYPDGGFVFHTSLRAYGYIYSSYQDFCLLSKYFGKSIAKFNKMFEVLEHPTIERHWGPMFTRSPSVVSKRKGGRLGFFTMDSIKFVIAKTHNWTLGFNGQSKNLCFYESDGANYSWAQIWIGARVFMYKDSDEKWYRDLVPYYPGVISFDNKVVEFRSRTSTTTTFLPAYAKTMICVLESVIGIRNEYRIAHSGYFLEVAEMMLITENGYHVHYRIETAADEILYVSINLDQKGVDETTNNGLGERHIFKRNNSFVYDRNVVKKTIKHPDSGVDLVSLQAKPRRTNNIYQVRFSNLHEKINDAISAPTNNRIETHQNVLSYTDGEDYLWLFDRTTKTAAVTHFRDEQYAVSIKIPVKMIIDKCGDEALKYLTIVKNDVIKLVTSDNQLVLNNVVWKI